MLDSSFFMNNRRRYGDAVSDNTISVFFSGSEIRKSCDVSYPFFADRNFFIYREPKALIAYWSVENRKRKSVGSSSLSDWMRSRSDGSENVPQMKTFVAVRA